ncbi:helix-turn-helix domain-containing protein [Plantibacter sp. VKM Ac-2876]|nr:helix-turn-helix transcriptional regulator [Plantibacter sp. VKM Ac-2876]MBF4564669.1 helix-turn-helix domain-containing protein [Plantibacter sp. VKM Ac-2876]
MSPTRLSNALGEFLRARREFVRPEQVGIGADASRRVPGLRREEVAHLASISPEYYLRIEQGRVRRPSEQVLLGLARALLLDDSGRRYLLRLASPRPFMRAVDDRSTQLDDRVARLLAHWSGTPAYVSDDNQYVVAANALARAWVPQGMLDPGVNLLVSAFEQYADFRGTTSPDAPEYDRMHREWEGTLRDLTAPLRYYGRPDDPRLQEIVGMLSARHPVFRTIWAEHLVKPQMSRRTRTFIEPLGWVDFRSQTFEVPHTDQFLTVFFDEPGSAAAAAIAYLAARDALQREGTGSLDVEGSSGETASDSRFSRARDDAPDGTKTNSRSPSGPGAFKTL